MIKISIKKYIFKIIIFFYFHSEKKVLLDKNSNVYIFCHKSCAYMHTAYVNYQLVITTKQPAGCQYTVNRIIHGALLDNRIFKHTSRHVCFREVKR